MTIVCADARIDFGPAGAVPSRFSVPPERSPPVLFFLYYLPANEMFAVWIPKDALAVDVRHGGVEGEVRTFVVVAEWDAVVVEEHFGLAERQWLMGVWRENAAYKIDGTAVVFRILRTPWAEMAVVVVDEHIEMAVTVAVDRAGRQWMEHGGLAVAVA